MVEERDTSTAPAAAESTEATSRFTCAGYAPGTSGAALLLGLALLGLLLRRR